MVKKSERRKEENIEMKDISKAWSDNYTAFSKMYEDSYLKLFKSWVEITGDMFEKMALFSKEATPQKYKDFFDEWIKTYQDTFGKFIPIPIHESNREILSCNPDMAKYKECHDMWIKMYEKAFDSFFEDMPTIGGPMKEVTEPLKIMAKIYAHIFINMSKMQMRSDSSLTSAYPGKNINDTKEIRKNYNPLLE